MNTAGRMLESEFGELSTPINNKQFFKGSNPEEEEHDYDDVGLIAYGHDV